MSLSKKAAQIVHTQSRDYRIPVEWGVVLRAQVLFAIGGETFPNVKVTHVGRRSHRVAIYRVTVPEGEFGVVYDKHRKEIATLLSPAMLVRQEAHFQRLRGKRQ